MPDEDPRTEELRLDQGRREQRERELGDTASDPDETAQHERRADKAAYLKAKLEERKRSEEQGGG